MTGSGDEFSVIEGLEAGADDFLPKPVRLDELVARVRAHLRKDAAWGNEVEDELRTRASVAAALGRLPISSGPGDAAEAVVRELANRTDSDAVAVLQLGANDQLVELAGYNRSSGVRARRAGPCRLRTLVTSWIGPGKAHGSRRRDGSASDASTSPYRLPDFAAGAPIYAGDDVVGILTVGIAAHPGKMKSRAPSTPPGGRDRLRERPQPAGRARIRGSARSRDRARQAPGGPTGTAVPPRVPTDRGTRDESGRRVRGPDPLRRRHADPTSASPRPQGSGSDPTSSSRRSRPR